MVGLVQVDRADMADGHTIVHFACLPHQDLTAPHCRGSVRYLGEQLS